MHGECASLYNAVREFKPDRKTGAEAKRADAALQQAIDLCSVSFKENDPLTVLIRQKISSSFMLSAMEALGDEALMDEEAAELTASAEKVMREMQENVGEGVGVNPTLPRITPYYTR